MCLRVCVRVCVHVCPCMCACVLRVYLCLCADAQLSLFWLFPPKIIDKCLIMSLVHRFWSFHFRELKVILLSPASGIELERATG